MTTDVQRRRPLDTLDRFGVSRGVGAIILLWLACFAPLIQPLIAPGASRLALTDAVESKGTIRIDGYLVDAVDFAERDGHTYSDKAPGQPFLAVPVYSAALLAGAEPASHPRVEGNLTLWWVTFWSCGVPLLVLIVLMAQAARRRGPPIPLAGLGGLAFGTMLLPLSISLYGAVLGAMLGFGAWLTLDGEDRERGRAWLAGGLCGLAVLVEYEMVVVAVVLGVALVLRRSWHGLLRFVAAGVPFLLGVLGYQWAAFGSPFRSGYQTKETFENATMLITGLPDPWTALEILFGARGLFIFTPIVLVGVIGLIMRWRRRHEEAVWIALAILAGFFLIQAGWPNPWGGESPGPRYVLPALPFLVLGVARIWRSMSALVRRVVLVVSLTSMVLASIVLHLVGGGGALIGFHVRELFNGGPVPTIFTVMFGPFGWILHLVLVGLAIGHVVRVTRVERYA